MSTKKILQTFIPLITLGLLLGIGGGIYGISTTPLLIASSIVAGITAKISGVSWEQMRAKICEKINKVFPAILILLAVGFLIGTWTFSGSIPMMVYLGIKTINYEYVIAASFIITAIVSTSTGTSWGSAGTVGVALMGIAAGLNVNLAATAGAVVTGAYFGDKMSPLSDTTNLASIVAGSNIFDHIKHLMYTTVPSAVITITIYLIVGLSSKHMSTDPEKVNSILTNLSSIYSFNVLLLIPPAVIIVGANRKYPPVPLMIFSGIVAIILGVFVQGFSFENGIYSSLNGFSPAMIGHIKVDEVIKSLITRGGMMSMMGTVLMIIAAFSFIGILSTVRALENLLELILKLVRSTGTLVVATILSCIFTEMIAGLSYIAIIVPGELYAKEYKKRNLAPVNLSRTLEDAGTMVAPLVPWSSEGAYMAATLGVATVLYMPWAFLTYFGLLFAVFYGFTGITIKKIDKN